MIGVLLGLAVVTQSTDEPINAAQFARLIEAAHADIADVSFLFEGFDAGFPEGTALETVKPGNGTVYQGVYAFRRSYANYATLLDRFLNELHQKPPLESHDTDAILRWNMLSVTRQPDFEHKSTSESPGGGGTLNKPGSPERILYLWYFTAKRDLAAEGFVNQGWEDVDGHRCLRFQVDEVPRALNKSNRHSVIRFWVDLARGGHPLKVEYRDNDGPNGVSMRSSGIKLRQLPLPDGRLIWFPVEGRTESFLTTAGLTRQPVGLETYTVLDGTVRFNQNLSDEVFTLKANHKIPLTAEMLAKQARCEIPPDRQDPQGIKERLDRIMVRADHKTEQLDASAPGEGWWLGASQAGLIVLGVVALAGVAVWKWRG